MWLIQTAALHWFDVGTHERENDSSVFCNSSFVKAFNSGDLNVPPMRNIPGTSTSTPLYFVREQVFPLKSNFMRPFQSETSISHNPCSMANFPVYGEQLDALLAYWLNISVFSKANWNQRVSDRVYNQKCMCCLNYTRGADKSLARPERKQARKHVRDARDFNNIETRAVIKSSSPPARQGAEGNSRHSDRNISLFPSCSG